MIVPPKNRAADFAAAGSKSHQPVSLIDLYPTLTDFCGLTPPNDLDGESLVPLLRKPDKMTGRAVITTFDVGNLTLRTERHRYIRYADGSEELYDNKSDPHEWENLSGDSKQAGLLTEFRSRVPRGAISK